MNDYQWEETFPKQKHTRSITMEDADTLHTLSGASVKKLMVKHGKELHDKKAEIYMLREKVAKLQGNSYGR